MVTSEVVTGELTIALVMTTLVRGVVMVGEETGTPKIGELAEDPMVVVVGWVVVIVATVDVTFVVTTVVTEDTIVVGTTVVVVGCGLVVNI